MSTSSTKGVVQTFFPSSRYFVFGNMTFSWILLLAVSIISQYFVYLSLFFFWTLLQSLFLLRFSWSVITACTYSYNLLPTPSSYRLLLLSFLTFSFYCVTIKCFFAFNSLNTPVARLKLWHDLKWRLPYSVLLEGANAASPWLLAKLGVLKSYKLPDCSSFVGA